MYGIRMMNIIVENPDFTPEVILSDYEITGVYQLLKLKLRSIAYL